MAEFGERVSCWQQDSRQMSTLRMLSGGGGQHLELEVSPQDAVGIATRGWLARAAGSTS
jgi:hypothetical protein